ncbi:hypothetical protein BDR06DRAFT_954079 [Suillus hirtellus]|nr:hypothetical protein BDR06DRAFT_954079 [Suillus hirtellus]
MVFVPVSARRRGYISPSASVPATGTCLAASKAYLCVVLVHIVDLDPERHGFRCTSYEQPITLGPIIAQSSPHSFVWHQLSTQV